MSEHDDFKRSLLDTSWRIYKTVEVGSTNGPAKLDIRMPPPNVLRELLDEARRLKDSGREEDADAQDFALKVIAATVWRPGALRPLFTLEEVRAWPYATSLQADCLAALNVATGLEKAKGNSEATPT